MDIVSNRGFPLISTEIFCIEDHISDIIKIMINGSLIDVTQKMLHPEPSSVM